MGILPHLITTEERNASPRTVGSRATRSNCGETLVAVAAESCSGTAQGTQNVSDDAGRTDRPPAGPRIPDPMTPPSQPPQTAPSPSAPPTAPRSQAWREQLRDAIRDPDRLIDRARTARRRCAPTPGGPPPRASGLVVPGGLRRPDAAGRPGLTRCCGRSCRSPPKHASGTPAGYGTRTRSARRTPSTAPRPAAEVPRPRAPDHRRGLRGRTVATASADTSRTTESPSSPARLGRRHCRRSPQTPSTWRRSSSAAATH